MWTIALPLVGLLIFALSTYGSFRRHRQLHGAYYERYF